MGRPSRYGVKGLYRDSNGEFRVDIAYRDPETGERARYRELLGPIKPDEAKRRAAQINGLAATGRLKKRESDARTVRTAFDEYLETLEVEKPSGIDERRRMVDVAVAVLGPSKPLTSIGLVDLDRYKSERMKALLKSQKQRHRESDRDGAGATINRGLAVLRHAFGFFRDRKWIDGGQFDELRQVKKFKEREGRIRHLSTEEEEKLTAALSPQMLAIVRAALHSGLRRGNLITMKKSWVDLRRAVITLPKTKSGRTHVIPITDELRAVLDEALARSRGSDFVFVSRDGEPYTAGGFAASWRRAVKRAGLKDARFHDLRHTVATRLRENGQGLDVIQRVLGHATLAMSARYAHLGQDAVRDALAGLGKRSAAQNAG